MIVKVYKIEILGQYEDNIYCIKTNENEEHYRYRQQSIAKHSPNLIDLIEVGDYVNGFYVERVWEQINNKKAIDLRGDFLGLNDDEYIEDVVTHQQFKSVMYEVK